MSGAGGRSTGRRAHWVPPAWGCHIGAGVPVPPSTAAAWLLQGLGDALKMSLVLDNWPRLCTEPGRPREPSPPELEPGPARPQSPLCTVSQLHPWEQPHRATSDPERPLTPELQASDKTKQDAVVGTGSGSDPGRPQAAGVFGLVRPGTDPGSLAGGPSHTESQARLLSRHLPEG